MITIRTPEGSWRAALILTFTIGSLAAIIFIPPISQDLDYHSFADSRYLLRIPNALNVLSNLPLMVVGIWGIRRVLRTRAPMPWRAWTLFFSGVALAGIGSVYYHWLPDNSSLVWDRLPMAIGFMGLLVALTSDYIDPRLESILLVPASIIGAVSVAFWHIYDDLRLYVWVQFMPLGVILLLLLLYNARASRNLYLILALASYMLAKVCEYFDDTLFQLLQQVLSGHTLKHLFAAASCYLLALFIARRATRKNV